jgi:tape measure domain-containing protein
MSIELQLVADGSAVDNVIDRLRAKINTLNSNRADIVFKTSGVDVNTVLSNANKNLTDVKKNSSIKIDFVDNNKSVATLDKTVASIKTAISKPTKANIIGDVSLDKSSLASINSSLTTVKSNIESAKDSFGNLMVFLGSATALVGTAAAITSLSDALTGLNTRIALVTKTAPAAEFAFDNIRNVALSTRMQIADVAELYQKLSNASSTLGTSQNDVAVVTQTVAKALAMSGASAQMASMAILQLGQGLSAGTLQGQDLKAVLEDAPALGKVISDSLGVTTGQLRAMGAAGQLTSKEVFGALLKGSAEVNEKFKSVGLTFAQAFINLHNSVFLLFNSINSVIFGANRKKGFGLPEMINDAALAIARFADRLDVIVYNIKTKIAFLEVDILNFFTRLPSMLLSGLSKVSDVINNFTGFNFKTIDVSKFIPHLEPMKKIVLDWVNTVERAFFWLYDRVIGHSWIPDLVEGIIMWIGKLLGTPIAYIKEFTTFISDAFKNIGLGGFFDTIMTVGPILLLFSSSLTGSFKLLALAVGAAYTAIKTLTNPASTLAHTVKQMLSIKDTTPGTVPGFLATIPNQAYDTEANVARGPQRSSGQRIMGHDFINALPPMLQLPAIGAVALVVAKGITMAIDAGPVRSALFGLLTTAFGISAGNIISDETLNKITSTLQIGMLRIIKFSTDMLFGSGIFGDRGFGGTLALIAKMSLLFESGRKFMLEGATTLATFPTKFGSNIVQAFTKGMMDKKIAENTTKLDLFQTKQKDMLQSANSNVTSALNNLRATQANTLSSRADIQSARDSVTSAVQAARDRKLDAQALGSEIKNLSKTTDGLKEVSSNIGKKLGEAKEAFRSGVMTAGAGIGGIFGALGGFNIGSKIAEDMVGYPGWAQIGVVMGSSLLGQLLGSSVGAAISSMILFAFTNPIGLAIIGISAAIVTGYTLWKNWDWFSPQLEKWSHLGKIWIQDLLGIRPSPKIEAKQEERSNVQSQIDKLMFKSLTATGTQAQAYGDRIDELKAQRDVIDAQLYELSDTNGKHILETIKGWTKDTAGAIKEFFGKAYNSSFANMNPIGSAHAASPNTANYIATARDIATKNKLNPDFVSQLLHSESGFNPEAISRTGNIGVGQLGLGVASDAKLKISDSAKVWEEKVVTLYNELGGRTKDLAKAIEAVGPKPADFLDERFNPYTNIKVSIEHLKHLFDKYGSEAYDKVAAAYNWGEGNLDKLLKKANPHIPSFDVLKKGVLNVASLPDETKNYVAKNVPKFKEVFNVPEVKAATDDVTGTFTTAFEQITTLVSPWLEKLKTMFGITVDKDGTLAKQIRTSVMTVDATANYLADELKKNGITENLDLLNKMSKEELIAMAEYIDTLRAAKDPIALAKAKIIPGSGENEVAIDKVMKAIAERLTPEKIAATSSFKMPEIPQIASTTPFTDRVSKAKTDAEALSILNNALKGANAETIAMDVFKNIKAEDLQQTLKFLDDIDKAKNTTAEGALAQRILDSTVVEAKTHLGTFVKNINFAAKEAFAALSEPALSAEAMQAGTDFAKSVKTDMISGIRGIITGTTTTGNVIKDMFNKFTSTFLDNAITGFVNGLMTQTGWDKDLQKYMSSAFGGFEKVGTGIGAKVTAPFQNKLTTDNPLYSDNGNGVDIATSIKQGIEDGSATGAKSVGDAMDTSAKTSLSDVLSKGWSNLGDVLSSAWKGLTGLFSGGSGGTGGISLGGIGNSISSGWSSFTSWLGFASGGLVNGPGTGTSDSIMAALSNGEFVVNADSTKKYGKLLHSINSGAMPKFADGGIVGNYSPMTPSLNTLKAIPTAKKTQTQSTFNINITGDVSRQTRSEIQKMIPEIAGGVNTHNYERGNRR